jgi:aspartate aminotransferase
MLLTMNHTRVREGFTIFPPRTPVHVQNAHNSIVPILDFLTKYKRWVASANDVCDFALGNPQRMPLRGFVKALRDAATPRTPSWYAYKTNEPNACDVVSGSLKRLTGLEYPLDNIFITNGATGAHLVVMNALLGPGDEVIINTPPWFFYEGMILLSGATPVAVSTVRDTFDLDVQEIERAITDKTRFVIVNSPNNPTGRVYSAETLTRLGHVLERACERVGHPIYLISDEVYRAIVYDGADFCSPAAFYKNTITVYSYGKTLLTPGQRLGYIALSPRIEDVDGLRAILSSSQILSGWAMASALMQHSLPQLEGLSLSLSDLQRRRDRLVSGLRESGYEVHIPEGAFYVTPKTPIEDDVEFCEILAQRGVLCLPGSVVKMNGYLRASITANDEMIERALPIFAAARNRAK